MLADYDEPSGEESETWTEMLHCARRAKYCVWESDDPSQALPSEALPSHALPSDSGALCGTELQPRQGGIMGYRFTS